MSTTYINFRDLHGGIWFYWRVQPTSVFTNYTSRYINTNEIESFTYSTMANKLSVQLKSSREPIEIFLSPEEYHHYFCPEFKETQEHQEHQ